MMQRVMPRKKEKKMEPSENGPVQSKAINGLAFLTFLK